MTALRKLAIAEKFAEFDELWSPKTLAVVGAHAVKAVKIAGPFIGTTMPMTTNCSTSFAAQSRWSTGSGAKSASNASVSSVLAVLGL